MKNLVNDLPYTVNCFEDAYAADTTLTVKDRRLGPKMKDSFKFKVDLK